MLRVYRTNSIVVLSYHLIWYCDAVLLVLSSQLDCVPSVVRWLPCHSCQVLLSDFFLCNCADEFMEAARHFIFETYCRIHHKIDIGMLAEKMVCKPQV